MTARRRWFLAAAVAFLAGAGLTSRAIVAATAGEERRSVGAPPTNGRVAEAPRVSGDEPLTRMFLALTLRDRPGLDRLLTDQRDPTSPSYRRWLTPEEFGRRFGPPEEDIQVLTSWLQAQGLTVDEVARGRVGLLFSGRAADVERAFATRLRRIDVEGEARLAAETAPSMPVRVARPVAGLLALHGRPPRRPLAHPAAEVEPLYNSGSLHRLAPADFARIYDADPLYAAGVDGTGTKIAIVGRTSVKLDDTRFFRSFFGLPENDPVIVLNGTDPGDVGGVEELEANLDVQWAGGVAPRAQVQLVVSKSVDGGADGVDLSSLYAVDNNVADVISVSFGQCEKEFLPADLTFYDNVWAQAAAQGMVVVVASGDSGAAGCESGNQATGTGQGVNGLSTPPYATCVGGTQFAEEGNDSLYWELANDGVTQRSAKSYIPEVAWNESGVAGGFGLFGTGGGVSIAFARPAWQAGSGVPAEGMRAVPDISVNGAGHTAYMLVQGHTASSPGLTAVYGTSASAPAFAGLAALLVQKAGGRVGGLNPQLYALGAAQYAGGGPTVFNDVVSGNNSVPGVTGFSAGPGYDLATGLGSPDMAALAASWSAAPAVSDFTLGASPAVVTLDPGGSATVNVTLEALAGMDVVAAVVPSPLPPGFTATFEPGRSSTNGGTGYVSAGTPVRLTLTAAANASPGGAVIELTGVGGSRTRRLRLYVTVKPGTPAEITGVEQQIPVVLDVYGAGNSHYTSDVVAVNRSGSDTELLMRYVAQPGTPGENGPVIARTLLAGRELYVPDVISFLRANGYALSTDVSWKLGTLFLTFTGVSDPALVFAGSRTTTPNLNKTIGGAFGTFTASTPSGTAPAEEAWVYGLRETGAYRSNLAVVHSPGGASSSAAAGPIGVEVQVWNGDTGLAVGQPTTFTLQAGELHQLNSVLTLAAAGVTNGYARVRRTSGSDRFIAYGVVNDGPASGGSGTSDGSFITAGGSDGLVPIVLDLPGPTHFQTELTLTSTSAQTAMVTLTYMPSPVFPDASGGGTVTTTLAPGRQQLETDALGFLRRLGLSIPSDGTKQGGTLLVTGAAAQARTYNPNPDGAVGGTYGLSYPAVAAGRRATTQATVYGLRQDADVRSNLAIADARAGDSGPVEYVIEIYDAATGAATPSAVLRQTLSGGQWVQVDSVLGKAGIKRGYARIRPATGTSDFVAYGVVNDGPSPGTRTSDGSYLPMVVSAP